MNTEQRKRLISQIQQRYKFMRSLLSEKDKKIWAASESITIGRGGDTIVCEATGISRVTIRKEKRGINNRVPSNSNRIRETGGGRKGFVDKDLNVINYLDIMIDPLTRGDPESPLPWTCKSTYKLAEAV